MTLALSDTAKLLALARGMGFGIGDDDATIAAWTFALNRKGIDLAEASEAVLDFTGDFIKVTDVIESVQRKQRRLPSQIEADVRAAKKLGFIDQAWESSVALPEPAAEALANYRAGVASEVKAIEATYGTGDPNPTWDAIAAEYGVNLKRA